MQTHGSRSLWMIFPANIEGASAIGMQAVLYRDLEQTIKDVNQILKQQNA